MTPAREEIARIDVGSGIYVRVPVRERASVPLAAYPVGAAFAAAVLLRDGATPDALLAAGLLMVLAALAGVDLRARVLPNRIVLPALAGVLAWQAVFAPGRIAGSILAGIAAGAFLLLPSLVRRGAVGMGDVKLAVLLGCALGAEVASALMIGFLAAGPVALVVLRRKGAQATLPYGPFLAFGAAVTLLA